MTKANSIIALETFRKSVMLSVDSLPIDDNTRAEIIIRFQSFYLSMFTDLNAPESSSEVSA